MRGRGGGREGCAGAGADAKGCAGAGADVDAGKNGFPGAGAKGFAGAVEGIAGAGALAAGNPGPAMGGGGCVFTSGARTTAGAAATGAGAAAGGGGGGAIGIVSGARPGWRGNDTSATPRQSFHASVASGGTGGLPWKVTSNTARFTSLPGGIRSIEARTSSSWLCTSVAAAISLDPGGTTNTYSRYVSGSASVASCSRLKTICEGRLEEAGGK